MDRTGQCACGAVKFVAKGAADTFSTCYCKTCQRWGGGPLRGVNVQTENLEVQGRENLKLYQSSDFAERANCKKCGSAIWYRLTSGKYFGNTSILVGSLDNTSGLSLSYEMFTDYKDQTNDIPEGVDQMTSEDVSKIIATFDEEA